MQLLFKDESKNIDLSKTALKSHADTLVRVLCGDQLSIKSVYSRTQQYKAEHCVPRFFLAAPRSGPHVDGSLPPAWTGGVGKVASEISSFGEFVFRPLLRLLRLSGPVFI